jgi:aldehyde:ferredoxin oxidoreductase
MPDGYHGRVLHVNLTDKSIFIEHPPEAFYRKYFGGSALGLYYVLHKTPPHIDAFDPANTLVLSLSAITGAPISGQSRMTATAKSPLSGAIGDSQCGGFFPAEMKFSGFDALVINGRSEKPVYLWLHNGEAEILPAEHLWGKVTGEVEESIKNELQDEKIEIVQCGPAGENGVRYASLINMCNRANGRTGMGAVMGSKNLKAVAVRGKEKPTLADRNKVIEYAKWGAKNLGESDAYSLSIYGTAGDTHYMSSVGGLPTRNWESGYFENAVELDGKTLVDSIGKSRDTCYACVIRCKPIVEIKDGDYPVDPLYGGPEYEALAAFGAYCGIDDLKAVSYANQLCNMYGMDTISCGSTIAWSMACYENGLIDKDDTGGIELQFGNAEAMVKITEMIAKREGFGDILGEGSARAARIIGKGTEDLVVAVKNQELPAHMPHSKRGLALIYAVNPFGADHQSHHLDPNYRNYPQKMAELGLHNPQPDLVLNDDKIHFALTTQYLYSCLDSINVCQFVFGSGWQLYQASQLVEVINAITGWDVTIEELLRVGERRLNMLRAFNAREGIGREEDALPKKVSKALVGGETEGLFVTVEEIEKAKDIYYAMADWDVETGYPKQRKLKELELEWLITE